MPTPTSTPEASESAVTTAANGGDMSDVIIGFAVALIVVGILLYVAFSRATGVNTAHALLAVTFGSMAGWTTGILASPYNKDEKGAFKEIGKIGMGFLTGYVVSKVDPLLETILPASQLTEAGIRFLVYLTLAACAFLAVYSATYVSRTYWQGMRKQA